MFKPTCFCAMRSTREASAPRLSILRAYATTATASALGWEPVWLGARLAVVRLVEELADIRVLEHALVHAPRDGKPVRFQRRYGRFHEIDGVIAKCRWH